MNLPEGKDNGTPEIKLLGKCSPPPHDRFVGLTGRIECELEAKTPIFISDSEFVEQNGNEHRSYRFFRLINDKGVEDYAIPSTSLRGMLRSVFEAATNSCFSVFEGGLLGKRERPENYDRTLPLTAGLILKIPMSKGSPGVVKKMMYYKLPHKKFPHYKYKHKINAKKVLVKISDNEIEDVKEYNMNDNKSDGYVIGYLKTSDKGLPGRKRNEYVFVEDLSSENFELSYETYFNYIIANRNNKNPHTKVPKPADTIWFRAQGKKIKEFGYAQIYRKPFKKSIGDLLQAHLHLHPCTDYNKLCPACRVFGWVHPDPPKNDLSVKVAYAGRVKISHAQIIENSGTLTPFPLAILSTPKPTTTFFYLLKNANPDFNVTYDTLEAKLRGRKFYRHQNEANKQEYVRAGRIEDHQNRTIRDALKPGAKFKFTIEFENLAPVELGALLWAIEMEDGMFHKLGMGKPLGFGSVKISIKKLEALHIKERYSSFKSNGWKVINKDTYTKWINLFKGTMKNRYGKDFDSLENIKDLRAILSSPRLPVHYPRTSKEPQPDGKNFEWFLENKSRGKMPLKLADEDTEGFSLKFEHKGVKKRRH